MLEDLINLKQQLKNEQEYVILNEINMYNILQNPVKTNAEIQALEKTNEIITECEDLMKQALQIFHQNNISVDSIQLSSNMGFICKKEFVDSLKKTNDKSDNLPLENLTTSVSNQYVPVEFAINPAGCILSDENKNDEHYTIADIDIDNEEIKQLLNKKVSGIVDFNIFINILNQLGYSTDLLDFGTCSNYSDYLAYYMDAINKGDRWITSFDINANLQLENKKESNFGSR